MFKNRPLTTPVLLLLFNRPDTTQKVFAEIRKARPAQLYISADGPREIRAGEAERCQAARDVIKQVDWDCEVHKNFREKNVGLKTAISSGIDWFFEHVEAGIILEDDCLPSQSFFWFCKELLEKYWDDERIMQISGNNYLFGKRVTDATYYFSRLNDIWGWATWKRAWRFFDVNMKTFPQFKEQGQLENYIDDAKIREWLMSYLEEAYNATGRNGLWSSQWVYAMCAQNGLTIVPSVNLVLNIGLLGEATHQADSFGLYSTAEREEITEIVHPSFILPNKEADALRFEIIRKTDPRLLPAKRPRMRELLRRYLPPRFRRAVRALIDQLARIATRFAKDKE
jgi:hypothetical protein